jgi:hypothetical protein
LTHNSALTQTKSQGLQSFAKKIEHLFYGLAKYITSLTAFITFSTEGR